MSTNALRGKGTAPARPSDRELAIGEHDREIFNCPTCQRPLATGASRCPGCGTRLLMGVQARKATTMLATGAVAGAIVGGLIVALILLAMRPATTVGGPLVDPVTGSPIPTNAPVQPKPVPRAASNALIRTTGLNARMAQQVPGLAAAVKPAKPNSSEVARLLRTVNSDAGLAANAVPALAAWPEGKLLAVQLEQFYSEVRHTAASALDVTLNNSAAYRRNGQRMVALLGKIDTLQDAARTLAEAHGINLGD
jgi:hypothetical protein